MKSIFEEMGGTYRQEGVTEALKTADQMEWVRCMNNIHNRAEEILFESSYLE